MRRGEVIDQSYQIIEEIGKGAGGIVYKAYHIRLQKYVVVKKIKDDFVGRLDSRGEVDILKRLHHMYLPQVYDFIQRGTEIYTVMDYVDGRDMEHYIRQGCVFAESQLRCWLQQLAEVLKYLHGNQIIHSDIKPSNIMITRTGDVCLIDFNISLDGEQDKILGLSYGFAAPEQLQKAYCIQNGLDASGISIGPRIDIYSLGAVFYQLIAGQPPETDPQRYVPLSHLDTGYSDGFIHVIEKCMRQDPRARYRRAEDILYALAHMEKQDSGYRRIMRNFALGITLSGMLILLGTGMLTGGLIRRNRENFQKDYYELTELAAAYEDQKLVNQGNQMLYEPSYQRYYEGDQEIYAEILYDIGLGYAHGNYPALGAGYMKLAAEASQEQEYRSRYYLEWVQLLLDAGNTQDAQAALDMAGTYGLGEEETAYIQAELKRYSGEYQEAVDGYSRALAYASDPDLCSSIYRQLGKVYWQLGDYLSSVQMLEQASVYQTERSVRRELAQSCMDLAASTVNSGAAREYRLKAIALYQQLNELPNPAFVDRMNLGVLYVLNGQYYEARAVFEALHESSEDYRVAMYLAYIAYELDDGRLSSYYEEAVAAYRKSGSPQDDNMAQLILLMSE
ncbi:MAG: protein kinase [Lachnospiraceae bacterium]|nr:protein kinase [Lachnospiraceae bacterium]